MPCQCQANKTTHVPVGFNLRGSVPIRELEGRRHWVVPTVMITEGVHAGSNGPIYYPRTHLQNSVPYWDGKPVLVRHPDGGGFAGKPDVIGTQRIGWIFNTAFDGKRLTAEAWIDIERARQVDPRIEDAILNKRELEVSTGLTFPLDGQAGTFNGREYHHTAPMQMSPDHLAILLDQRGACSIKDGCGLLRNEGWPAPTGPWITREQWNEARDPLLAPVMNFGDHNPTDQRTTGNNGEGERTNRPRDTTEEPLLAPKLWD